MWTSPSSSYNFRVILVHFAFSVILFESDCCSFVNLSSLSSLLVYRYPITCCIGLAFGLYWQQYKKMCLPCTNRCVLFCLVLSIFGRHLLGNMTPKLNRGCVTFIERFVHFCLKSHEPMSLFLWQAWLGIVDQNWLKLALAKLALGQPIFLKVVGMPTPVKTTVRSKFPFICM